MAAGALGSLRPGADPPTSGLFARAAAFFTVVAVAQMAAWAIKKQRRYVKEFGKEYPRGRKAIFPFIL